MNTGRPTAALRHGRGRLTLAALSLVLAAVLLAVLPHFAVDDEPASRSDGTIVGRITDVLGDMVFETKTARSAPRHTTVVGGPPQPARTASDGWLIVTACGGTS
ncbi:hypothetical protein ACIGBH_11715 [Streptomyces sp. NPDC085929]|uniref:hypothetical protein n=1 Tax=Streptomyces sp. NPDC085929 TaxID=3365739 RepID=UPI0037D4307E